MYTYIYSVCTCACVYLFVCVCVRLCVCVCVNLCIGISVALEGKVLGLFCLIYVVDLCCSVLPCVAVCCRALQCVADSYLTVPLHLRGKSVLQWVTV